MVRVEIWKAVVPETRLSRRPGGTHFQADLDAHFTVGVDVRFHFELELDVEVLTVPVVTAPVASGVTELVNTGKRSPM